MADVRGDDAAAAATGEPATTEMRQLTTDTTAVEIVPPSAATEMADIHVSEKNA